MSVEALKPFIQWLHHHPTWAGIITFVISTAESLPIIGYLIPGSLIMPAIGALVGAGILPMQQTLAWAIFGAILGDGLSYWLGRHYHESIRDMWPFTKYPKLMANGEQFFKTHGGKSVFIGRFIGAIRPMVPVIAGMMNMPRSYFFLTNVTSGILWAPVYMLPGIIVGIASLELPPELATRFILYLIAILVSLWMGMWLIKKIIAKLFYYADNLLDRLWAYFSNHRSTKGLCNLLKDPLQPHHHGQLTMAIIYILCVISFLTILCLQYQQPMDLSINQSAHYFFRSLRTGLLDCIMASITQLGSKNVLAFPILAVFSYLLWKKHWRTAAHWIVNAFLVYGAIGFFKYTIQTPRPPGLLRTDNDFSFPSGHSTFAIAMYAFFFLIITRSTPSAQVRRIMYYLFAAIASIIIFSRLYLGAHWVTDTIGGFLLGMSITMVIAISYRREKPENFNRHILMTIAIVALTIGLCFKFVGKDLTRKYAPYWPEQTMPAVAWWEQDNKDVTLYRRNRTGKITELINVQWLSPIDSIEKELIKQGWERPARVDLINALNRITPHSKKELLPLIAPLYQNQKPILVMTKKLKKRPLLVLHLWSSHVNLEGTNYPLWLGVVSYHIPTKHRITKKQIKKQWKELTAPTEILKEDLNRYHYREIEKLKLKKQVKKHRVGLNGHVLLIKPLPGRL